MKKIFVLLAIAVGCDDVAYRGVREELVQEDDEYNTNDGGRSYTPRGETVSMRRMYRDIDESSRESLRQRRIESDIRNGFIKSGYRDIDETIAASNILAYGHKSFWSQTRILKHGEADASWKLQADEDKGPSEERMGSSDRKSPAWVGKPLGVSEADREPQSRSSGVSTGKALKRFFLGTGDERL